MAREFYGATLKSQKSINALLSLPASGKEQDWEFELADPDRTRDMINIIFNNNLNYEEKCAISLIIISSLGEYIELYGINYEFFEDIKSAIKYGFDVREEMIFYLIDKYRFKYEDILNFIIKI